MPGEADSQLLEGTPASDWTRIFLHNDIGTPLRRSTPERVNSFSAAEAQFVPIFYLPTDKSEPAVASLNWDDATWDKFSSLVYDYNTVRNHQLGHPSHNLLLGYADYQQFFDTNADMCWGDDGYIYLWADSQDIAKGDFTKVRTDYQCG